jgi:hypothetical protein
VDDGESKAKKRLASFTQTVMDKFCGTASSPKTAISNLMSELQSIRSAVAKERLWLKHHTCTEKNKWRWHELSELCSRKMLYLFVRDLLVGVNGKILDNKNNRNNSTVETVSRFVKALAWLGVVAINAGMLFYVYLFAMLQPATRQEAVRSDIAEFAFCVAIFLIPLLCSGFDHLLFGYFLKWQLQALQ